MSNSVKMDLKKKNFLKKMIISMSFYLNNHFKIYFIYFHYYNSILEFIYNLLLILTHQFNSICYLFFK